MSSDLHLTQLLEDWARGDKGALDQLMPVIYPQLRNFARAQLRSRSGKQTMQPTAIVNELFLKLLASRPARFESREHFYALAARMIRSVLVDEYRRVRSEKRGGELSRIPLHEDLLWINANSEELLDFEIAMTELEALDRQQADLFGMRFLLGCTSEEVAELSGLSKATVDRKVKLARAWLFQRLAKPNEANEAPIAKV
jgi:RNA polymerase sigma factor (TIGR02999 family)